MHGISNIDQSVTLHSTNHNVTFVNHNVNDMSNYPFSSEYQHIGSSGIAIIPVPIEEYLDPTHRPNYKDFVLCDPMKLPPHPRVKEKLKVEFPHLLFTWDLADMINKSIISDTIYGDWLNPFYNKYKLARVMKCIKPPTRPLSAKEWSQWYKIALRRTFECETPQERADAWVDAKWFEATFPDRYPPSRILETFDRMSMSLWMFPISPTPTYDEMIKNEHCCIQRVMKWPEYRADLQDQLPIVVRKRWIERNLQKVWHKLNDIKFMFI